MSGRKPRNAEKNFKRQQQAAAQQRERAAAAQAAKRDQFRESFLQLCAQDC
jgi:hypothetical protein